MIGKCLTTWTTSCGLRRHISRKPDWKWSYWDSHLALQIAGVTGSKLTGCTTMPSSRILPTPQPRLFSWVSLGVLSHHAECYISHFTQCSLVYSTECSKNDYDVTLTISPRIPWTIHRLPHALFTCCLGHSIEFSMDYFAGNDTSVLVGVFGLRKGFWVWEAWISFWHGLRSPFSSLISLWQNPSASSP